MKSIFIKIHLSLISLLLVVAISSCNSDEGSGLRPNTAPGDIETIAGLGPGADNFGYEGDGGLAINAKLGWVTGICLDKNNDIYVTDGAANVVRMINHDDAVISTFAGTFIGFNQNNPIPDAGDAGPAVDAHLNVPLGIALDFGLNAFIADAANNKIRMIAGSDAMISTLVGGGNLGYAGDNGLAANATIANPQDVAIDSQGNIYVADSQNNAIRRIDAITGIITTFAGLGTNNAGYTGDGGQATMATLNLPVGVAIDQLGNFYISDSGNNVIRKISNGIISTVAGSGALGYDGDGGMATNASFKNIRGIAIDHEGNLYIADTGNHVIRKVDGNNVISTFAGNGIAGYSGDGGPATSASLNGPWGVGVDMTGNVYIADSQNSVVRMVAK